MNKFIILFCFGFVNACYAQTITINDCIPVVGDKIRTTRATYTITPGPAGTNQIWDFSAIKEMHNLRTDTIKAPASPYSSWFPAATVARVNNTPEWFYRTGVSGLELVGRNQVGLMQYQDPRTILPSPFTYGDTASDTWQYTMPIGSVNYTVKGSSSFTADATGYLITPGGYYSNVLRVHTKSIDTYTGSNQDTGGNSSDEYRWYKNGIHEPLLTSNSGISSGYPYYELVFVFNAFNGVDIPENNSRSKMQIYPNPVSEELIINSPGDAIDEISVINSLGQLIYKEQGEYKNTFTLRVSSFPNGFYLVTSKRGNKVTQEKFIVTHQ
jgi:hypothetical protein